MEKSWECQRTVLTAPECPFFVNQLKAAASIYSTLDGSKAFLGEQGQCLRLVNDVLSQPADQVDEVMVSKARCPFATEIYATEPKKPWAALLNESKIAN